MRNLLIALVILWSVAFFGSFIAFLVTPVQDFGLTAGWNKIGAFMAWQGAATILAVFCLFLRWSTTDARLRAWAAVPAMGVAVLVLIFGGLYLWSGLQRADPSTTAPATLPTTQAAPLVSN